jgi:hypothetical protein
LKIGFCFGPITSFLRPKITVFSGFYGENEKALPSRTHVEHPVESSSGCPQVGIPQGKFFDLESFLIYL